MFYALILQAGSTPLHVAALRHHSEVIKVLRYYHADVYTQNKVTVAISHTHWWLGVSLYVCCHSGW